MPHVNIFANIAFVTLAGVSTMACGIEHHGAPDLDLEYSRAAISAQVNPTGVAVDDATGQRFFLDPQAGIFEEMPDGELVNRWAPTPELPVLTDLCAVGGGRFVAAADGDGYVIDIASGAARQHFCLEPGWDPGFEPGGEIRHLNRSVACDIEAGLIYGQPQTMPLDGNPLRSEIASYRLSTGRDVEWVPLPSAVYHAGGMTVLETGQLLLGAGSMLSLYEADTQRLTTVANLATAGVEEIDAISIDREAGTVLLVDAGDNSLVSVTLDSLGL